MANTDITFDFSSILSTEAQEEPDVTVLSLEEEEEQEEKEEIVFNFSSALDKDKDYYEASEARQIAYGFRQEPMVHQTLGRMVEAGAKSLFTDDTYSQAFRASEMERQDEIFRDFPEFSGLRGKEQEETGYMTAGRVTGGIIDPTTWLIPWTKFGKVGTVIAGGAVGGTETALREYALYGDVAKTNVLIGTTVGAVSATAGLGVQKLLDSRKAKGLKTEGMEETAAMLDKAEEVLPSPLLPSTSKSVDTSDEAVKPMGEVVREYNRKAVEDQRIARGEIILTDTSPQADYVKAYERQLRGQPQSMTIKLTTEETKAVEVAAAKLKQSIPEETVTNTTFIATVSRQIDKDKEKIESLKVSRDKTDDDTIKSDINKKILSLRENIKGSENTLAKHTIEYTQQRANTQIDMLEDMSKEGSLTSSIMQKVLYETARPIGFGLGGTAIGLTTMEEDDGWGHVLTYAGVGAGVGVLQKRIQRSDTFTDIEKETGKVAIKDASAGWLSNASSHLKYITGGSTATRMDAMGGWTKVIGNRLFSKLGSNVESVESKTQRLQSEYLEKLFAITGSPGERSWLTRGKRMFDVDYDVVDSKNKAINTIAGEIMRGYTRVSDLSVGYKGLKNDQAQLDEGDIAEIQKMVPQLEALRDSMASRMEEVGITFKKLDQYGLHQVWDRTGIDGDYSEFLKDLTQALRIQRTNAGANDKKMAAIEDDARTMAEKISGRYIDTTEGNIRYAGSKSSPVFSLKNGKLTFRSVSKAFEKERLLQDVEATKFMYEKGYLNLHAGDSMSSYGTKAIKVAEFSEAFGAGGEIINLGLRRVRDSFDKAIKANPENANFLKKRLEAQEEQIVGSLESYWGGYGQTTGYVETVNPFVKGLTTLANATYLTTVSIANLGDLVQPFTNSSYGSAVKTLSQRIGKGKQFSEMSSFKYDKAYERDLSSFMRKDGVNSVERRLDNINDFYFFSVGLSKVTQMSRNFAYDVGVNRAFVLSKKSKLKKKELDELAELKLTRSDLERIGSFDTAEEAFKRDNAYDLLDVAGRSATDRDAIIPSVGNRLLFTQTNNTAMRSIGQFMSWAQAKTSQTNRLLERVENDDAQLALKIVAATPVYAGFLSLKNTLNPYYIGEDKDPETTTEYLNAVGKAMKMGGSYNNAVLDKVLGAGTSTFEYDKGVAEALVPSLGLMMEFSQGAYESTENVKEGDILKALKRLTVNLPVVSQVSGYTEKLTGEPLIEVNNPKRKPSLYSKGGEVLNVPKVPTEPDERVDKMTGIPYNQQAGTAFTDVADREDPLQKLGFGI